MCVKYLSLMYPVTFPCTLTVISILQKRQFIQHQQESTLVNENKETAKRIRFRLHVWYWRLLTRMLHHTYYVHFHWCHSPFFSIQRNAKLNSSLSVHIHKQSSKARYVWLNIGCCISLIRDKEALPLVGKMMYSSDRLLCHDTPPSLFSLM